MFTILYRGLLKEYQYVRDSLLEHEDYNLCQPILKRSPVAIKAISRGNKWVGRLTSLLRDPVMAPTVRRTMGPEEASTRAKTQDHGGYTEGKLLSIEEEDTVVPVNIKVEPTTEVELAQDVSKEAVHIKASKERDEAAPPARGDQHSWHRRGGPRSAAAVPGTAQGGTWGAHKSAHSLLPQPFPLTGTSGYGADTDLNLCKQEPMYFSDVRLGRPEVGERETHEESLELDDPLNKEDTEEVGDSAKIKSQTVAPADDQDSHEKEKTEEEASLSEEAPTQKGQSVGIQGGLSQSISPVEKEAPKPETPAPETQEIQVHFLC